MTLVTLRVLWCEASDCEEEIGPEHFAQTLRDQAKREGWTRRDYQDFCARHSGGAPDRNGA